MYDRLLSVNPKVSVIHRSALTDWMRMKHRCRERFTNIKTSEHELHRIPCLGFEASVRITCEYLKLSRLVVIIHLEYSGVVIVCLDAFKTSQVKWWASELWAVVDTMGWTGADQKRSLAGFYCTYTSPFLTLFFAAAISKHLSLGCQSPRRRRKLQNYEAFGPRAEQTASSFPKSNSRTFYYIFRYSAYIQNDDFTSLHWIRCVCDINNQDYVSWHHSTAGWEVSKCVTCF